MSHTSNVSVSIFMFRPLLLPPGDANAIGALQFSDIADDRVRLIFSDLRLRRHIAKVPVMLWHATLKGQHE